MRPEFDIVVIGGGSGGLVVAAGGASLGAKVAVVEKHKLGGDCLWYGCVPSKTLLKSARIAYQMQHADRWASTPSSRKSRLADVMERVAGVIRGIEPNDSPERFRGLGVDVIFGEGRFDRPDTFEVGGRRITAKNFVIATGSRPAVPPIRGIERTPYLTNETVFALRENVPHLLVIGSGPIGSEMAQAFRRLGSEVTVVDIAPAILPREDRDLAQVVHRQLAGEGIRYHLGVQIVSVEGRPGDVRMMITKDGMPSNAHRHASARCGGTQGERRKPRARSCRRARRAGTHRSRGPGHVEPAHPCHRRCRGRAAVHARRRAPCRHRASPTIFRMKWAKPSLVVPWATYTDPELARVGLSESEAKQHGIAHRVYRFPLDDIDRARAEGETEGLAKLVTAPNGKLLGAAIVAPHAGELIAECALALSKGMKAADLSATIHAYPTFAMVTRRAADQRLKEGLTPSSKVWIKRLFGLQGA